MSRSIEAAPSLPPGTPLVRVCPGGCPSAEGPADAYRAHFMHKLQQSAGELQAVKRVARIAMVIGLPCLAPAIAQTPYDGVWNVTVETRAGSCEPSVHYPVTVSDGKISAAGADITGNVGRDGHVRASIGGAFANGNLNGSSGSGKWSSASAGAPCSGRWEASKQ